MKKIILESPEEVLYNIQEEMCQLFIYEEGNLS